MKSLTLKTRNWGNNQVSRRFGRYILLLTSRKFVKWNKVQLHVAIWREKKTYTNSKRQNQRRTIQKLCLPIWNSRRSCNRCHCCRYPIGRRHSWNSLWWITTKLKENMEKKCVNLSQYLFRVNKCEILLHGVEWAQLRYLSKYVRTTWISTFILKRLEKIQERKYSGLW